MTFTFPHAPESSEFRESAEIFDGTHNGREKEFDDGAKRLPQTNTVRPTGRQIIGRSSALRAVLQQVEIVAPTHATVLILGETGTGKDLIAEAIHNGSPRNKALLVKTNCAAIPSGLLESELFGHEKGAFTGALVRKPGRFEVANRGTLFLDEVGDIPLELQPKLLRVLQEQEFERLGSTQVQKVNVRMVAATSRDLSQMSAERQFRSDLYYRLNVFPIRVPALRERVDDIPLLVRHFVEKFSAQLNKHIHTISNETLARLKEYHWPGNIRELQNIIERAVIMTNGGDLQVPVPVHEFQRSSDQNKLEVPSRSLAPTTLADCEREHILHTLHETRWMVGGPNGAASILGLKRTTLIYKMKKLGISRRVVVQPNGN